MWMRWMMAMSWQVSLVVAVVFALSLLARKASARFRYALWCLVLIKLCLPPTFSLVTGIGRWLPAVRPESVKSFVESDAISKMAAPISDAPLPSRDLFTTSPQRELPPASTEVASSAHPRLHYPAALFALWLAGVLFLAILLGFQYKKMRGTLLGASPVKDRDALGLIDEAKASLGVKTSVRFFESPNLFSPLLLGLFRPHIIIPAGTLKQREHRQMLPIFLHELAHFKRRDLWANWVQVILQILYWFHPLVWLANFSMRKEREMIVDDMVLVHLKGEREAYGRSLVSILKRAARKRLLAPGYVGIVETRKSLSLRLRRILDANRKLSLRLGWMSLALVIALALILIPQARALKAAPEPDEIAESAGTIEKDFPSSPVVGEAEQVEEATEPAVAKKIDVIKDARDPSGWVATLPNGVTIELIGVSFHPSRGQSWWKPDGSPLAEAPYERTEMTGFPDDQSFAYEFAVKFKSPGDEDFDIDRAEFLPPVSSWGGGGIARSGDKPVEDVLAWMASAPKSQESATLRWGAAAGPWETLATRYTTTGKIGEDFAVIFSTPIRTSDKLIIAVTHRLATRKDFRVIMVDIHGNIYKQKWASSGGSYDFNQTIFHFDKLPRKEIKEFRYQVRPYQWVEFRNVFLPREEQRKAWVPPKKEWRTVCKHNLKRIGLACLIYLNDYNNFFPPDFEALRETGSHKAFAELMKCLAQEEDVGYVYIGAGRQWKTLEEATQTIIAYDKKPVHDNGRNVLFMDGHVEWMPEEEFQKLLAEQKVK
jgi:prepilin-type processing-associated H-X9-DG protein